MWRSSKSDKNFHWKKLIHFHLIGILCKCQGINNQGCVVQRINNEWTGKSLLDCLLSILIHFLFISIVFPEFQKPPHTIIKSRKKSSYFEFQCYKLQRIKTSTTSNFNQNSTTSNFNKNSKFHSSKSHQVWKIPKKGIISSTEAMPAVFLVIFLTLLIYTSKLMYHSEWSIFQLTTSTYARETKRTWQNASRTPSNSSDQDSKLESPNSKSPL